MLRRLHPGPVHETATAAAREHEQGQDAADDDRRGPAARAARP